MKKNYSMIIPVVIAIIMCGYVLLQTRHQSGVINSTPEMYRMVAKAIADGKTKVKFKSSVAPGVLSYNGIMNAAMSRDLYAGIEFFEYLYTFDVDSDGNYKVSLKLYDATLLRTYFGKKRIKELAKCFEGLSDYEKVKAVHDYIILYNEYDFHEGGAYEAIVKGRSACNGYALAFYGVMKEMNIPVACQVGDNHMWNSVQLDGKWYNIDLTWDDAGGDSVRYDYFLKCDEDWHGHDYGKSDATESLAVTGRSASEYYDMVPNFKVRKAIYIVIFILICIGLMYVSFVIIPMKAAKKKKLEQELLEKSIQANRKKMAEERELNNMDS